MGQSLFFQTADQGTDGTAARFINIGMRCGAVSGYVIHLPHQIQAHVCMEVKGTENGHGVSIALAQPADQTGLCAADSLHTHSTVHGQPDSVDIIRAVGQKIFQESLEFPGIHRSGRNDAGVYSGDHSMAGLLQQFRRRGVQILHQGLPTVLVERIIGFLLHAEGVGFLENSAYQNFGHGITS